MQPFTGKDLAQLLAAPRAPALLLGAGASMPALPVSVELKTAIIDAAVATIFSDDTAASESLGAELVKTLEAPHLTLELLCSMLRYRLGRNLFDPVAVLDAALATNTINPLSRLIAALRRQRLLGPILTTNFDTMLPRALDEAEAPYVFKTEAQLADDSAKGCVEEHDIFALHGTLVRQQAGQGRSARPYSPPITAEARGLAQPFSARVDAYLRDVLSAGRAVIAIGYSGSDHYDVNPFFASVLEREKQWIENWYWLSYTGQETSFSELVQDRFRTRLFAAKADGVFEAALSVVSPAEHRAWRKRVERVGATSLSWKDRVSAYLTGAWAKVPEARRALKAWTEDLLVNLHGAWVVTEHYRLESIGYDQQTISFFGGVSARSQATPHLRYQGVDFERLLEVQHIYWNENLQFRSIESGYRAGTLPAERLLAFDLQETERTLTAVLTDLDQALESTIGPLFRLEDRAMLRVAKAVATDYLGLVWMRRIEATELVRSSTPTPEFEAKAVNARREAIQCFERVEELSRQAARDLTGDPANPQPVGNLHDLIPVALWETVGRENRARCYEGDRAIHEMRRVVGMREKLADDEAGSAGHEYLLAHVPQLWLRASELVKLILRAPGSTDLPSRWKDIRGEVDSESYQELATRMIELGTEAYRRFGDESARGNYRFCAYFDARVVYHASRGEAPGVDEALQGCRQAWSRAYPSVQKRADGWVANIERRVEACRRAGLIGNV